MISGIQHREYISFRFRHHSHKFSKRSIDPDSLEIRLDQITGLEKRKHCLVTIVCKEFTLLSNSLCINGIWFDHPSSCIRNSRSQNQWNQQTISSRHICNKEDCCHWCLHHTGHQTSHTYKHEILLRHKAWSCDQIDSPGQYEACNGSYEKCRSEGTSHPASGIGERH